MSELLNEAGSGVDDEVISTEQQAPDKPVSIRDSLVAALSENDDGDKPDRARDEAGRFAPKTVETPKVAPAAVVNPAPGQQPVPVAAPVAAAAELAGAPKAPPGWAPEAKAVFDTLPDQVKAAISKREQEVDQGFRVLQDYKGLEEFTPLMKQAGTSHADVMRKAIDWERALQRDPVNTVINVAKMAGVNLQALVAGQTDQILQRRPQAQPQPQPQPVNVEATVEQVMRKRDLENQAQAFLSDPANAHAEAVLDNMVSLINTGQAKDIKEAYDMACWMRPDIRQQLISQQAPAPAVADPQIAQRAAAADQARRASRSITGSSSPGPSKDAGPAQPSSIRDTLRSALSTANGRV